MNLNEITPKVYLEHANITVNSIDESVHFLRLLFLISK